MFALRPYGKKSSLTYHPFDSSLFGRFFDDAAPWGEEGKKLSPAFDISETDDSIVVKADLPGVDIKDLDISVGSDNVLTVKGEKKEEREEKNERHHRIERRSGSFSRSFFLGKNVKTDEIDAEYKDGVLYLTIPKSEEVQKKIEVKMH